ncbi:MAG: LysM peptidoglycan-binding domain-containing protein, partial [Bacteroidota bacterium]
YLVRKRDILTLDLPNQAPILNPDPQLLSLHLPSCESISPSISTQSASSRLSLRKQPITPSRKSYLGKTRGATQFAYHMVEEGESLYSISVLSGITIEELQDLNDQPLDDLYVGKEIRVPATFGGTVYSSRHFTLPEKEKRYLDFDSDPSLLHTVYRVGGTPPNNQRASSQHMGSQNFLHNARRGETVISISLKYDISPIELMKANQLRDLDGIVEGQLLEIPR